MNELVHCIESRYSLVNLLALIVVQAVADFISAVAVLFVVANLFRQLRTLCRSAANVIDTRQNMSISSPTNQRPQVLAGSAL